MTLLGPVDRRLPPRQARRRMTSTTNPLQQAVPRRGKLCSVPEGLYCHRKLLRMRPAGARQREGTAAFCGNGPAPCQGEINIAPYPIRISKSCARPSSAPFSYPVAAASPFDGGDAGGPRPDHEDPGGNHVPVSERGRRFGPVMLPGLRAATLLSQESRAGSVRTCCSSSTRNRQGRTAGWNAGETRRCAGRGRIRQQASVHVNRVGNRRQDHPSSIQWEPISCLCLAVADLSRNPHQVRHRIKRQTCELCKRLYVQSFR